MKAHDLVESIPAAYFESRVAYCSWARPSDRASLHSMLTGLTGRYANMQYVEAETATFRAKFMLLRDATECRATYFAPVESALTPEMTFVELVRWLKAHHEGLLPLSVAYPQSLTADLLPANFAVSQENWFVRMETPEINEHDVHLEVLDATNLETYRSLYDAVCATHPAYTSPQLSALEEFLRRRHIGLESRQRGLIVRSGKPVGIVTWERLDHSNAVIDFYGFMERHPENTRSLYALVAAASGCSRVCGVKTPRHLAHLERAIPERRQELILSHVDVRVPSGVEV